MYNYKYNIKNKAKMNKKQSYEIIFGIHPIIELLNAKKRSIFTLYTTKPEPKAFSEIKKLLTAKTAISYVTRDKLNKLAGETTDHQGFVAAVGPYNYKKEFFDPKKDGMILLLDGVQDTKNMGAIIRSAYCTGFSGLVIPKKGNAPITAATFKSSAGLAEHMNIYQPASNAAALQELKNAGYGIYLAMVDKGVSALEVEYKKPLCLVIGSEGPGISRELQKEGVQITLPQRHKGISYNASVAAGILLFLIANK
jgi:23S rRNA (guanosine2251-2'-O)-methyltransferase